MLCDSYLVSEVSLVNLYIITQCCGKDPQHAALAD